MNKTIRKIVIAVIALITIVSVSGIAPVSAQTPTPISAQIPAFNFTRNLTIGSTGEDVRALQQFLNAQGFAVATTGAGSPGNESTRFGPRTQSALARFQTARNISPARGFFGPITRARVMALATPVVIPGILSSVISAATPVSAIIPVGNTATGRADIAVTTVRYTATNEPVILQDITVTPTGARSAMTSVEIVDGTRIISMPVPSSGPIVFTDANIEIPANSHRDIVFRADFAGIGHGAVSGSLVELDVNVTKARGRSSNANITTGLDNIAGGNSMIIRQTAPTVTIDRTAVLGVRTGREGHRIFDHEVLRINITADAGGDVFLREIRVIPTIASPVLSGEGVAVFQGAAGFQGTTERGRIMNMQTTGLNQNVVRATNDIIVGAGEVDKYQIGQRVRIVGNGVSAFLSITNKDADSILLSQSIGGNSGNTVTSVSAAGFFTDHSYRIPLTGAFIPRGTTSSFSVFTNLVPTPDNMIQIKILSDDSAGATGNFIWGEGINTPNINGHLIRELPITGPTRSI